MLAAAYIRVSSKGQNLQLQQRAIETAAHARGDTLRVWHEKRTAKDLDRPELDALRLQVRAGRVKRLYVFRLDRLTRSGIRDTFELIEELHRHGCELVTCSDGFDLSGPMAEPLLALMAWAAKMERHATRERQAAARERLEAEGRAWGRPRRLTSEQEARALQLEKAGASQREIARRLKAPAATIGRALRRLRGSKSSSEKHATAQTGC